MCISHASNSINPKPFSWFNLALSLFVLAKVVYLPMFRSLFLVWLCFGLGAHVWAQTTDPSEEQEDDLRSYFMTGPPPRGGYAYLMQAQISAPHLLLNEANARAFDAIVQAELSCQRLIFPKFYLGLQGRYTAFNIFYPPIAPGTNNTGISDIVSHTWAVGPKISYMWVDKSGVAFMPSISGGYSEIRYTGIAQMDYNKNLFYRTVQDQGWYLSGWAKLLYFPFEDLNAALSMGTGLTYFSHQFSKSAVDLDGMDELQNLSDQGGTLHLDLGLGILIYLGRRR